MQLIYLGKYYKRPPQQDLPDPPKEGAAIANKKNLPSPPKEGTANGVANFTKTSPNLQRRELLMEWLILQRPPQTSKGGSCYHESILLRPFTTISAIAMVVPSFGGLGRSLFFDI